MSFWGRANIENHSAEYTRKLAALMAELNRSAFRAASANYVVNMKDIDALECHAAVARHTQRPGFTFAPQRQASATAAAHTRWAHRQSLQRAMSLGPLCRAVSRHQATGRRFLASSIARHHRRAFLAFLSRNLWVSHRNTSQPIAERTCRGHNMMAESSQCQMGVRYDNQACTRDVRPSVDARYQRSSAVFAPTPALADPPGGGDGGK